jgi:hypothetical protein
MTVETRNKLLLLSAILLYAVLLLAAMLPAPAESVPF